MRTHPGLVSPLFDNSSVFGVNANQFRAMIVFATILVGVAMLPPHKEEGCLETEILLDNEWVFRPAFAKDVVFVGVDHCMIFYERMTGAWLGLMGFTVVAGLLTMVLLKDSNPQEATA